MARHRQGLMAALRDSALVVIASTVLALAVNEVRPAGLPLIAQREYEILVPCPDIGGEVDTIAVAEAGRPGDLFVDARPKAEFTAWHPPGAMWIPFDYLEPAPDEMVRRLARSGARRVVVYGDGGDPDSGRELGRELAGRGVRNVVHLAGGAKALRAKAGSP